MERLQTGLAAAELENKKDEEIPDLSMDEMERLLKKDRVTAWLKDTSEVLKNHVTSVPSPTRPSYVGGKQGQQLSIGGALACRVWKIFNVAHTAYVVLCEGDRHLCHLCRLWRPCHHDTEGGALGSVPLHVP